MAIAAIAAAAAPVIGGIIGNMASAGDRAKAQAAYNNAMQQIFEVGNPDPQYAQEVLLEKFEKAGILTPQLENDIKIGVSQVSQIVEQQELKDTQMKALGALSERARGGLTPEDRAALNQARLEAQVQAQGGQQAILQNMQQRGMGGSGSELIARLMASQQGANQASQQGDRLAAMASQNALQAAVQSGNLAGNIRGQDFDVNRAKASAADEFEKFNVANAVARQTRNVGTANQAQLTNLQRDQLVSDKNVQALNEEKANQKDRARQLWLDKLSYGQAKAGAYTGQAARSDAEAKRTAEMWSGIGSGVGKIAGSGAF